MIDISWPITETMTEYKDRSTVQLISLKSIEKDTVAETLITFHSHTGTHIDVPAHFLSAGKTIDLFALETFIGMCKVIDLTDVLEAITDKDLEKHTITSADRILLKTRNSQKNFDEPFDYNFVYLASSGAYFLANQGVQLVGIDYLGIERNQPAHETHIALLSKGIPILEGLRLKDVKEGKYWLNCLPLAIPGIDAVPARALLQKIIHI